MSADFLSRLIGMVVLGVLGAQLGADLSASLASSQQLFSLVLGLVGVLFGLVVTPYLTVRPVVRLYHTVSETPMEVLFTSVLGLLVGLTIGVLLSFPLSLLGGPLGAYLPAFAAVASGFIFWMVFNGRSREVWLFMNQWLGIGGKQLATAGAAPAGLLLVDSSVLIDGRVVDIAHTGFLQGTLVVPRFIIDELHRVADASDPQRRNRGRRGLAKLNELQRDPTVLFRIIEDDIEDVEPVDDKLVALALKLNAPLLTIDFALNQVARAQGVTVLNMNALANAVRAALIPGETFTLRVLQEGREADQGVGYLEDGTMVVVEKGREYLDRTITVEVTKLISKEAGRIIFARPIEGK
ncbi:MAG TPA: PIN domain-containing protein [Candidatus Limnocylindrales bacterium]|nr:PIN domain-containing protein [Candidatus Limnocylindrales bacterium]